MLGRRYTNVIKMHVLCLLCLSLTGLTDLACRIFISKLYTRID